MAGLLEVARNKSFNFHCPDIGDPFLSHTVHMQSMCSTMDSI